MAGYGTLRRLRGGCRGISWFAVVALCAALLVIGAPVAAAQTPPPPASVQEAAAFAQITRDSQTALRAKRALIARRGRAALDAVDRCPAVRTAPRRVAHAVETVISVHLSQAAIDPLKPIVRRFSRRLLAVRATDSVLSAAAVAYRWYVGTLDGTPRLRAPMCAALTAWGNAGWGSRNAPLTGASIHKIDKWELAGKTFGTIMRRGSHRMAALGVDPRIATVFRPERLLNVALPAALQD
jgi:hypothetical protein